LEVGREPARGTVGDQLVVRVDAAPARAPAPHQAQLPVGIPAAVADPTTQVPRATPDGVACERRVGGQRRPDRLAQRRGAALVGVEAQHPVAARLLERELLLGHVARPVAHDHPARVLARDLHRAVAAARIDHDDLVAEGHALQARGDAVGLVAADHDGGEPGHPRTRCTDCTPRTRSISFITALSARRSVTHRSKSWIAVLSSLVATRAPPMLTPVAAIDLVMRASTPGWSTETTRTLIWRGTAVFASHSTSMRRAGSWVKACTQSRACTVTPRPRVTKPTTSSPGSG